MLFLARPLAALPLLVLAVRALPIVDPGLFVIMGVSTCGNGSGYCLLGVDCTLDDDFVADTSGGHCRGLLTAFTPSAHFVCCRYSMEPGGDATDEASTEGATDVAGLISLTTPAGEAPQGDVEGNGTSTEGAATATGYTSTKVDENLVTAADRGAVPGINLFIEPENRRNGDQYMEGPDTSVADQRTRINDFVEYFNTFLEKNTYTYDPTAEEKQEVTTVDYRFDGGQNINTAYPSSLFDSSNSPSTVVEHAAMRPTVHPCWMVFLQDIRSADIICAGAMIANNRVLTTATCATRLLATGINYIGLIGSNKQIRNVSIHQDFSSSRFQQTSNNIGLLKLTNGKVEMQECILPLTGPKIKINSSLCGTFLLNYDYGAFHTEMCSSSIKNKMGNNNTLSITCDRSSDRDEQVVLGTPLVCEGTLSGIAVHTERDIVDFIAVTPYVLWILQNT